MIRRFYKWVILALIAGILAGIASAVFLYTLDLVINYRKSVPWIVVFLPITGLLVAWFYQKFGQEIEGGSNLILDEIQEPKKIFPIKMVPMIFLSSALSHLFGASVGREGVAVQMGAALSDQFSRYFGVHFKNRSVVLMIGMSAGFASIFGAPLAGAIFGIEILLLSTVSLEAIFPCLLSAFVGHYTAIFLGVTHHKYAPVLVPELSLKNILLVVIAAICFGLVARFFVWLLHWIKDFLKEKCPNVILHPLFGGTITVLLFFIFGTDRYQSIGQEIINASFEQVLYPWDFLGKIVMTSLSVGSGFKGGEVMSLFFIGATLGNALSFILPLAISFLAALGFVSVFAGASNTPLTCFFLALSLFGNSIGIYAGLAVIVSYLVSGHRGIYQTKRKHRYKKF